MTENEVLDGRSRAARELKAKQDARFDEGTFAPAEPPKPAIKPKSKTVGTGEGLVAYEKYLIRIAMGNRINARGDQEGTATSVNIMQLVHSTKMRPESAELDNRHAAGCILAAPGNPNDTTYWFEAGTVKIGQTYPAETIIVQSKPGAPAITSWKELKITIS